jgi:hypothetical protein
MKENQKQPIYKSRKADANADANADEKGCLIASKLIKESDKHFYCKHLFLVSMYCLFYGN